MASIYMNEQSVLDVRRNPVLGDAAPFRRYLVESKIKLDPPDSLQPCSVKKRVLSSSTSAGHDT